ITSSGVICLVRISSANPIASYGDRSETGAAAEARGTRPSRSWLMPARAKLDDPIPSISRRLQRMDSSLAPRLFTHPGSKGEELNLSITSPLISQLPTLEQTSWTAAKCQNVWPGRAGQDRVPRSTNVRAATMYQASRVERFAPGHHGYPRASKTDCSKDHFGTQSRGCAGQTVRPSLHSISQTRRDSDHGVN